MEVLEIPGDGWFAGSDTCYSDPATNKGSAREGIAMMKRADQRF
jgi:hypothetical protein